MKSRLIFLTLTCLFASLAHSFADLRIVSAYFVRTNHNVDVRPVIDQYVDHGIFSFRVSGRNLGGWQNPGRTDFLRVVYEVDGKRYTTDSMESQVFTFVGVPNARPGTVFARARSPLLETATIRISNRGRLQLSAFSIDRAGAWHWQAEISPGRTTTEVGLVGHDWAVVTRSGSMLGRVTIKQGENRINVGG